MLLVSGYLKVDPEAIAGLRDAVATMVAASRAEEGCIDYAFSVDLVDPSLIRISERWVDRAALAAHFEMPHMAAFQQALATLAISERDLFMMESDQLEFSM